MKIENLTIEQEEFYNELKEVIKDWINCIEDRVCNIPRYLAKWLVKDYEDYNNNRIKSGFSGHSGSRRFD